MQYLVAFFRRSEEVSDVISGRFATQIALDKSAKFRGPCLKRSREIPPEAVRGSILYFFSL